VYTSASSTSPNARAVATTPAAVLAPSKWKPNISVATPTPKKTSIPVPSASAMNLRTTHYPLPLMSGNDTRR
jgi:hypothetical protein